MVENNKITPVWSNFFLQLINELNRVFSTNRYLFPKVSEEILNAIASESIGSIAYDSTNNVFKLNNNGSFEEIQT